MNAKIGHLRRNVKEEEKTALSQGPAVCELSMFRNPWEECQRRKKRKPFQFFFRERVVQGSFCAEPEESCLTGFSPSDSE